MENNIYIDFVELGDYEDFYEMLKTKLTLPDYFGDNLDALHDVISGDLKMPLHLEFVNLSVDQLDVFDELICMLEEEEEEVEGFTFSYFLEQFEDEDENDDHIVD